MRPRAERRRTQPGPPWSRILRLDPLLVVLIIASMISIWSGVRDYPKSAAPKEHALQHNTLFSGKAEVSSILDIETLAYDAYTKYSFAIHPRAIMHHLKQKHFPEHSVPETKSNKRLLIFFESELPTYADQALHTLRNNSLFDVLVITTRTQGFCTRFRPEFFNQVDNIRVVCMSRTEMDLFATYGLCSEWQCNSHDFTATYRQIRMLSTSFPVRALLGTTFRDQITSYSGWAWADMTLMHGDYESLFPTELLELDVLTFPTHPSRHDIHLRKSLSIFSNTEAIRKAWLWVPLFKNATTFVNTIKFAKTDVLSSIDEGRFSRVIVHNKDITYAQIPRLLGEEKLLGWKTSITMRGDRRSLLTLPEDTSSLDEEAYFQAFISRTKNDAAVGEPDMLPLTFQDFSIVEKPIKLKTGNTTSGNVHMKAIPIEDRIACYFYSPEQAQDKDGVPAIIRSPSLASYNDIAETKLVQEAYGLVGASAVRKSGVPLPFQGATDREAREILFYQMTESSKSWPLKGQYLGPDHRLRFKSGSVEVADIRPLR